MTEVTELQSEVQALLEEEDFQTVVELLNNATPQKSVGLLTSLKRNRPSSCLTAWIAVHRRASCPTCRNPTSSAWCST